MKNVSILVASSVFAISSASAASFTIYTDRTSFESALSNIQVEDFDDGSVDAPVFVTSTVGTVANGRWEDQVSDSPTEETSWSFGAPIVAFGGDWDLDGPSGPGTGIQVTAFFEGGGFEVLADEIPRDLANEFWGFITDMPLVNVLLQEGTQVPGLETYHLDNLTYSPIPVPAAAPLMLAGLGALGLRRRHQPK